MDATTHHLPVVNLMGPTACGKTALACQLYESGRFELISVDSALIFQDMNIGTAKPTPAELERYPHHLINILPPTAVYSVAEFVHDAEKLIEEIHARGKIPLLVGGTMLYFKALLEGLAEHLPCSNADVRARIQAQADAEGWHAIHAQLAQVDPQAAAKFKVTDRQRLMRALEVYYLTGTPISVLQAQHTLQVNTKFHFYNMALVPDRTWLHQRIAERLDMMWQAGFLDEVVMLTKKYILHENLPSMRCVGYRQVFEFLKKNKDNAHNREQMQLKARYATQQLAKRQYTWLRSLQQKHRIYSYNQPQQAWQDLQTQLQSRKI